MALEVAIEVDAMLEVCCDPDGHRRQLQGYDKSQGCGHMPDRCTPDCATMFVPFYLGCSSMMGDHDDTLAHFFEKCSTGPERWGA